MHLCIHALMHHCTHAQMHHMHLNPSASTLRCIQCTYPGTTVHRCNHEANAPLRSCIKRTHARCTCTAPSPPRRTCPGGSWRGSRGRHRRAPAPTGTSAWPGRARGAGGRPRGRPAAAARCRCPWGGDEAGGGCRGGLGGTARSGVLPRTHLAMPAKAHTLSARTLSFSGRKAKLLAPLLSHPAATAGAH